MSTKAKTVVSRPTKGPNAGRVVLEIRAGEKGTGEVLFSYTSFNNPTALDSAYAMLSAWRDEHPNIEVLPPDLESWQEQ